MKIAAFINHLKSLGVRVSNGSRHYKLYYEAKNGHSVCPRHPGREISPDLQMKILKQLGLK